MKRGTIKKKYGEHNIVEIGYFNDNNKLKGFGKRELCLKGTKVADLIGYFDNGIFTEGDFYYFKILDGAMTPFSSLPLKLVYYPKINMSDLSFYKSMSNEEIKDILDIILLNNGEIKK